MTRPELSPGEFELGPIRISRGWTCRLYFARTKSATALTESVSAETRPRRPKNHPAWVPCGPLCREQPAARQDQHQHRRRAGQPPRLPLPREYLSLHTCGVRRCSGCQAQSVPQTHDPCCRHLSALRGKVLLFERFACVLPPKGSRGSLRLPVVELRMCLSSNENFGRP